MLMSWQHTARPEASLTCLPLTPSTGEFLSLPQALSAHSSLTLPFPTFLDFMIGSTILNFSLPQTLVPQIFVLRHFCFS